MDGVPVLELTREEIILRIEAEARRRRGLSAGGLLRAFKQGRLKDYGEVMDLLCLADLLAEDDPIFNGA